MNKFDKSNPRHLGLLFCCVSAVPLLCGVVEYLTQPQRPLAGLLQFALFPATGLLAYFLCFHVLGHKKISQYFITGLVVSAVNMLALYISMQLNGFALEDIYLLFIDLVLCLGAFVDACVVILLVKMASFGKGR